METGFKRYVYYNRAQMKSLLVRPRNQVSIIGRGGGKTTNIQAPRIKAWSESMPRCSIGLLGASYMQLFTRILPGIIKGFNEHGWKENRDYWVGGYAPKLSGVKRPFKQPIKSEYLIHIKNGGVICLLSQDRPGMSNGVDLHALAVDEAKYIDKRRMDDEVIPAIRGEAHVFGKQWCYQGRLYTSDMPSHASGYWLLDIKGSPEKDIDLIEMGERKIQHKLSSISEYTPAYQKKVITECNNLSSMLNAMRSRTTMVQFASSLQNLEILGQSWIKHMLENLGPEDFQRSILTIKRLRGKQSFYDALDWDKHGYTPSETQHVRDLGYNFDKLNERDCRFDMENEFDEPFLHLGIDSGGSFNCAVVAMQIGRKIYIINEFWLHHPGKIKDVILKLKMYYAPRVSKRIVFHYDQTQIGQRAESEYTAAEIVVNTLRSAEYGTWFVDEHYMRQSSTHQWRFDMYNELLKGHHQHFDSLSFNKLNCEAWYESCVAADVKQVGKKLEKDKSSEKRDAQGNFKVSQEKATHLSEAGDAVVVGILTYNKELVV